MGNAYVLVRKTGLARSADRSCGAEKQSPGLFFYTHPSSPVSLESKNIGITLWAMPMFWYEWRYRTF